MNLLAVLTYASLVLLTGASDTPLSAAELPTAAAVAPTAPEFATSSIPLPGGQIVHSSPTLADLDGDRVPEILVGTTAFNGSTGAFDRAPILAALRGDGSTAWHVVLEAPVNSSPAVGDLDGDGHPEVLVSTGGDLGDRLRRSSVAAFDRNGGPLWSYPFDDVNPPDGFPDGAFSSPTLCDLTGDGTLEVIAGALNGRLHVIDHLGRTVWIYDTLGAIWSTAACTDLNADGRAEIITGSGGGAPGGYVYVFDSTGRLLARRGFPETIQASPAVGDLNRDGMLEIVVGTSWEWWNALGRTGQPYVYVFDTSQLFSRLGADDPGKLPDLPGWPRPTPYPGFSSPALGDLDGDGDLEIVIGSGDPFRNNDANPGAGMVHAWHHTGQAVAGWPVRPKNLAGNDAHIWSSPVLGDVDGDGQPEVLFAMLWDVHIYNADGSPQELLEGGWTVAGAPAIGDTDGDGHTDIWIGSSHHLKPQQGWLWHYERGQTGIGLLAWPSFHSDQRNGGRWDWTRAHATVSAASLYYPLDIDLAGQTTSVKLQLTVGNRGGSPLDWTASHLTDDVTAASASAAGVTIAPKAGTVPPAAAVTIVITLKTAGLEAGLYSFGAVAVSLRDEWGVLQPAPVVVPLAVFVGPLESVYAPLVMNHP